MNAQKKNALPSLPVSALRVSAASLHPHALAPGFAALFFILTPSHASVSAITVECRLLWRRPVALTGFGMGACRGRARGRLDKL